MKALPDPAPEQWATHRLVSIAARLHERRLNRRLARFKLTTAALDALEAVAEREPVTATDVAAALCVTRQSLGKVLRRLEALGYVSKERGRDGRSADLHLTREGHEVLSAAENLVAEGTGTESGNDIFFRQQLEQHVRYLRDIEPGTAIGHRPGHQRARTLPGPRHGQEQEQHMTHLNESGATPWLQQTAPPDPKPPFKKQPRQ